MNRSSEQRVREMQLAIALWQESGLSKYAFCKREKLSRATFNYWLVKYGHGLSAPLRKKKKVSGLKTKSTPSFVAIDLEPSPQSEAASTLELEYPNGVKLRLPNNLTHAQLHSYIKLY